MEIVLDLDLVVAAVAATLSLTDSFYRFEPKMRIHLNRRHCRCRRRFHSISTALHDIKIKNHITHGVSALN